MKQPRRDRDGDDRASRFDLEALGTVALMGAWAYM
jgi:hypothetical protein